MSTVKFTQLFALSSAEITVAFQATQLCGKADGLKLLTAPYSAMTSVMELLPYGRMVVITPRAVGKAHLRNKIRRQLKAIFYEEKLYEKAQIVIVLVYKPAINLSFDELKSFLVTNLTQCTYKPTNKNPYHRKSS